MQILSESTPKARKEHTCNYCSGIIEKGEKYNSASMLYDGFYVWKSHITCQELSGLLNMDDGLDDGVTQDYFMETIMDEYFERIGKPDKINIPEMAKEVYALVNPPALKHME